MRRFLAGYVNNRTGYFMCLSEASYNQAMDWLQRECEECGKEIFRTENNGTDDMLIYVGTPKKGINPMTGEADVWYTNQVIFHYDESRGYLMQE